MIEQNPLYTVHAVVNDILFWVLVHYIIITLIKVKWAILHVLGNFFFLNQKLTLNRAMERAMLAITLRDRKRSTWIREKNLSKRHYTGGQTTKMKVGWTCS